MKVIFTLGASVVEAEGEVVFRIAPEPETGRLVRPEAPERTVPGHPGAGVSFFDVDAEEQAALEDFVSRAA